MYALRTFDCGDCGAQVAKRAASGATVFCTPCSIARSGENARQLHAHSGPFWDQWQWNNRLAVRRRLARPGGYMNTRTQQQARSAA